MAHELSWLMMRDPHALSWTEASAVERVRQQPWVEAVYGLVQQFVTMIRERQPDWLDRWIAEAKASDLRSYVILPPVCSRTVRLL